MDGRKALVPETTLKLRTRTGYTAYTCIVLLLFGYCAVLMPSGTLPYLRLLCLDVYIISIASFRCNFA